MEWDQIRTGKELHEFAIANFEGQPGPYVLMVDEVQGEVAVLLPKMIAYPPSRYATTA